MALTRAQKATFAKTLSNISGGNVHNSYYKHGVLYGNYFDLRIYKDVRFSFKQPDRDYTKTKQGKKRDDSTSRTRVNLYRLVSANIRQHGRYKPLFATYTFSDNIIDRDIANLKFKIYIQKLSSHLGYNPKYIVVPENQKRGAWHFHVVFFNLPKMNFKDNDKMWGQGTNAVNIQYIRGISDISAYLAKYLSKDMVIHRELNKKLFFSSRGLLRPIDVFNTDAIDSILKHGRVKVLSVFEGKTYTQTKYSLV